MMSIARIYKPRITIRPSEGRLRLFLGGSITKAPNWQKEIEKEFSDLYVDIYNPRRDDWDESWVEDMADKEFNYQVNWELSKLDASDIILLYFDPTTNAPISLLELGLYARSGKLIVCCPIGYYKKGNVDIICKRFEIPLYEDINKAIDAIRNKCNKLTK